MALRDDLLNLHELRAEIGRLNAELFVHKKVIESLSSEVKDAALKIIDKKKQLAETKRSLGRKELELDDKTKVMNQYVHEDITDGYKRMRECLKEWEP